MVKKMLVLGVTLVMLFLFTACGYPTEKFNSLAELQAVFPKDVYYFDFNQEGIKEAGKFELTKTSNNKLEDGSYNYIRYSIWYNVEYQIDGKKQERKLRVVAADITHSMSFGYKNTEAFNSNLASVIELMDIVVIDHGLFFDKNKNALFLDLVIKHHNYFYYFILEGVQVNLVEEEVEIFLSLWSFAIKNKISIS